MKCLEAFLSTEAHFVDIYDLLDAGREYRMTGVVSKFMQRNFLSKQEFTSEQTQYFFDQFRLIGLSMIDYYVDYTMNKLADFFPTLDVSTAREVCELLDFSCFDDAKRNIAKLAELPTIQESSSILAAQTPPMNIGKKVRFNFALPIDEREDAVASCSEPIQQPGLSATFED